MLPVMAPRPLPAYETNPSLLPADAPAISGKLRCRYGYAELHAQPGAILTAGHVPGGARAMLRMNAVETQL